MKQAIQRFGLTWRRWLIPVNGGILAVCSLYLIFTKQHDQLYLCVLTIALVTIVLFELWYYWTNKRIKK